MCVLCMHVCIMYESVWMNTYDWYILHRMYLNILFWTLCTLFPSFKKSIRIYRVYIKKCSHIVYMRFVYNLFEEISCTSKTRNMYNGVLKRKKKKQAFFHLSRNILTVNAISWENNSRKINDTVSLISDVQNLLCLIIICERISFCMVSLSSSQRVNRKKKGRKNKTCVGLLSQYIVLL